MMKGTVKLLTVALASSVLMATTALAAGNTMKIGVVDAKAVFDQVPQGQATANQFRSTLKPEVDELTKEGQALAGEGAQLEKDKDSLSQQDYQKKQNELNQKMQELQQKRLQISQQSSQKSQELVQSFEKDFTEAVSEVGKKDGFDLILIKQVAPYYKDQFDVTSQVVTAMEAEAKAESSHS